MRELVSQHDTLMPAWTQRYYSSFEGSKFINLLLFLVPSNNHSEVVFLWFSKELWMNVLPHYLPRQYTLEASSPRMESNGDNKLIEAFLAIAKMVLSILAQRGNDWSSQGRLPTIVFGVHNLPRVLKLNA